MNESQASHDPVPSACRSDAMLPPSATVAKAVLILLAVINIVTSPFTTSLNALVIMAVKTKSRLRAHKSNILLACLATTDLIVGVIVQPMFVVVIISIVLGETSTGMCVLQHIAHLFTSVLVKTSLIHLVLISGDRYLAMKHTYAYHNGLVTEARLLFGSALAWLFSLILHIPLFVDQTVFFLTYNTFIGLSLAVISFCQFMVYREVRRHEMEISTQQVTEEARQNFLRNKKAFKLSAIMVSVLFFCYIPILVLRIVLLNYRSSMPITILHPCFFSAVCVAILNSLLNPLIYSVRMRQFRVAFTEIICRTANIAEAEEIEMRLFGSPNAVGVARQGHEGDQQNAEQPNVNNDNNEMLPRNENHIEQLNN